VFKLTGSLLTSMHYFQQGHNNLNGNYVPDTAEASKGNSLMLKSCNGNIELIEAMLVLQGMNFGTPIMVDSIQCINPY